MRAGKAGAAVVTAMLVGLWPRGASAYYLFGYDVGNLMVEKRMTDEPYPPPPGVASEHARQQVAERFLGFHSDSYDFLIVFPAFAADLGQDALGLHSTVRCDESGTGHRSVDLGELYRSQARLRSYIDVGSLMPEAADSSTEGALGIIAHEVAHSWSGMVELRDPQTGQNIQALLGRDGTHWSFFLNSDASVLYGSKWKDLGGGMFQAVESRRRYSALDLYLMGFLAPSEVPPFSLIMPDAAVAYLPTDLPPVDGTAIAGVSRTVAMSEILASNGARLPPAATAQHVFRSAFIILVAPNQEPTPSQIAFVDQVRRAWANEFFFLTRGRGIMETDFVENVPGPFSSNPSVASGFEYLLSRQQPDGHWADHEATAIRETQTALEALAMVASDQRAVVALERGADYLAGVVPEAADAAGRMALGLSAAHRPAMAGKLSPYSGITTGYSWGYTPTVIDSVLIARARVASGVPLSEVLPTVDTH
jgi:hypothetical protein